MGIIIAGASELAVAAPVRRWSDTGLAFTGLRHRLVTRYVTVRWSGEAGLSPRVFRRLMSRQYAGGRLLSRSAHLCVDPDGAVYQFANLDRLCALEGTCDDPDLDYHVGSAAVTILAVNPGGSEPRARGVTRALMRETIHGVDAVDATLTGAQLATVKELVTAICAHYTLPIAVPMEAGDVVARRLGVIEAFQHEGVLGHYMLSRGTRGPGLAVMRALAALPLRGKNGAAE